MKGTVTSIEQAHQRGEVQRGETPQQHEANPEVQSSKLMVETDADS